MQHLSLPRDPRPSLYADASAAPQKSTIAGRVCTSWLLECTCIWCCFLPIHFAFCKQNKLSPSFSQVFWGIIAWDRTRKMLFFAKFQIVKGSCKFCPHTKKNQFRKQRKMRRYEVLLSILMISRYFGHVQAIQSCIFNYCSNWRNIFGSEKISIGIAIIIAIAHWEHISMSSCNQDWILFCCRANWAFSFHEFCQENSTGHIINAETLALLFYRSQLMSDHAWSNLNEALETGKFSCEEGAQHAAGIVQGEAKSPLHTYLLLFFRKGQWFRLTLYLFTVRM